MPKQIVDTILPTTMVGSYPRPHWYTQQLLGRDVRVAFKEVSHEEAYHDATQVVLRDQEDAGLDIVTDGQMSYDDYVGAIGSRANNARRRERLRELELTEEQIDKLHGPIGLYIGSKTPYEIAVSILAELTAVKNGVPLPAQMSVEGGKALAAQAADDPPPPALAA